MKNRINNIKSVVDNNHCISCGLCSYGGDINFISKKGMLLPDFNNVSTDINAELLYDICPGKGYPIVTMGKSLFPQSKYSYKLGSYLSLFTARSNDEELLDKSSSGAIIPTIANYLLDMNLVEGVLTSKYLYTKEGPIAEPFIAKNKKEIILSQGSKYQPVPLLKGINKVRDFNGKVAVIGTPCQIAGIRLLQNHDDELRSKIKYTISNFCGGFRDLREKDRLIKLARIEKSSIKDFRYRGDGQPGYMRITDNIKTVKFKYPDYSRMTGYVKNYRCRLCVDATGELADISLGDAWIPQFLNSGYKWSIGIIRSEEMLDIVNQLIDKKKVTLNYSSEEEVVKSQSGNLITKKERQSSRFRLNSILGGKNPKFDGGYNKGVSLNIFLELKVLISHNVMYMLELIGIYQIVARIFKRINYDK